MRSRSLSRPLSFLLTLLAGVSVAATAQAGHHHKGMAPGGASAKVPLAAYDTVRAALAADDLAAAKKGAAALQAAAKKAAEGVGHPAKHNLHALAAAAGKIAAAGDLPAARAAFGDASRAVLELVAADAALSKRVITYRCGMTKTYKKWVQLSGPMANPYMGQKMLHCGSKVPAQP